MKKLNGKRGKDTLNRKAQPLEEIYVLPVGLKEIHLEAAAPEVVVRHLIQLEHVATPDQRALINRAKESVQKERSE